MFEEFDSKLYYEVILNDEDLKRILEKDGVIAETVGEMPNARFINFYVRRSHYQEKQDKERQYAIKKRQKQKSDQRKHCH